MSRDVITCMCKLRQMKRILLQLKPYSIASTLRGDLHDKSSPSVRQVSNTVPLSGLFSTHLIQLKSCGVQLVESKISTRHTATCILIVEIMEFELYATKAAHAGSLYWTVYQWYLEKKREMALSVTPNSWSSSLSLAMIFTAPMTIHRRTHEHYNCPRLKRYNTKTNGKYGNWN